MFVLVSPAELLLCEVADAPNLWLRSEQRSVARVAGWICKDIEPDFCIWGLFECEIVLGLVKKLGFVLAPARTRLARKQNAGLLFGSPSFADTASRSRRRPKMGDNLFTSSQEGDF